MPDALIWSLLAASIIVAVPPLRNAAAFVLIVIAIGFCMAVLTTVCTVLALGEAVAWLIGRRA